jgi:mRNA interferase MazF
MANPGRGEIWLADLRPTRGREQTGRRPVLVLSVDFFNAGPADLIVVLPLTSTQRDIPLHVKIGKGDGGIRKESVILCEAIRSISKDRLISRWGTLSREAVAEVEDRLRILLGL